MVLDEIGEKRLQHAIHPLHFGSVVQSVIAQSQFFDLLIGTTVQVAGCVITLGGSSMLLGESQPIIVTLLEVSYEHR